MPTRSSLSLIARRATVRRVAVRRAALAAAAAVLLLSSCAATPAPKPEPASGTEQEGSKGGQGNGGYAFGTDRDQMATAIEKAFSSSNGKARWEGDTLVLAIKGDVNKTMAGYSECRILDQLLKKDDLSVIEFPNGRVDCVVALAD